MDEDLPFLQSDHPLVAIRTNLPQGQYGGERLIVRSLPRDFDPVKDIGWLRAEGRDTNAETVIIAGRPASTVVCLRFSELRGRVKEAAFFQDLLPRTPQLVGRPHLLAAVRMPQEQFAIYLPGRDSQAKIHEVQTDIGGLLRAYACPIDLVGNNRDVAGSLFRAETTAIVNSVYVRSLRISHALSAEHEFFNRLRVPKTDLIGLVVPAQPTL